MQSKDFKTSEKSGLTVQPLWEKVVEEKMIEWNVNQKLHDPILNAIESFTPMMIIFVIGFLIGRNKSQD